MAKTNFYIFLSGVCFIFSSCNFSDNRPADQLETVTEKLEPVKSGIIYMKSTSPVRDNEVERVIYFDDYGSKVRIESTVSMKVKGQTVSNTHVTIDANGFSSVYDPEKKTGTKSKINQLINSTDVSFTPFTLSHMQKEGTEEVAGKTCDIYTIKYPEIDSSVFKYDIWNSIKLRETISSNQFSYDYIATKFDENVEIQPVMFLVPDSIRINEHSIGDSLKSSSLDDTLERRMERLHLNKKVIK